MTIEPAFEQRAAAQRGVPVVELANEFGVSMNDMLAICDRLGTSPDADQAVRALEADRIRALVLLDGPDSMLGRSRKRGAPRRAAVGSSSPELASVWQEGVRTRLILALALIIVSVASLVGVLADRLMSDGDAGRGGSEPSSVIVDQQAR